MNLTPIPRNQNLSDLNEKNILAVHEEKKPYLCSSCNAAFSRRYHLNRHVSQVHENKKPFQCGTCQAKFLEEHELKRHISTVHEEKKPYKCSSCNAAFSRRDHLIRHVSGVHENRITFQCGTCQVKFFDEHELKRHIFEAHEDEKEKLYKYTRSNAALSRKIILDNHESGIHERPKNVKLTNSQSKSHEIIYAGEKMFACKFCGKRFAKSQSVHQEKKTDKCSGCNAASPSRYHLDRHESGVHVNKKEFQCGICLVKFLEQHELKRHISMVHEKKNIDKFTRSNAAFARKNILENSVSGVHESAKVARNLKQHIRIPKGPSLYYVRVKGWMGGIAKY